MRTVAGLTVAGGLLLALGACSGSEEPAASSTTTPAAQAAGAPTIAPPTGDPVPEALSQFRCDPDGAGTYQASGVLANSTKAKVTFQVTVYVGEATGAPASAKTEEVPKVAGGGSIKFVIDKIPAPADGGTCHVQVLTTK
jgi:hypothetical protein